MLDGVGNCTNLDNYLLIHTSSSTIWLSSSTTQNKVNDIIDSGINCQ